MRGRRRSRSRLAGLVVGAAVLGGGLVLPDWWTTPEPPEIVAAPPVLSVGAVLSHAGASAVAAAGHHATGHDAAAATEPPAAGPVSDPVTAAPVAAALPAANPADTVEVKPGDTPMKLLARIGVTPEDAQAVIRKLAQVWDPRELMPGQTAAVLTQSDRLLSFRLALAPDRDIVVARDHTGGFVVEDQDRPTREIPTVGGGMIHSSLSAAASRASVPPGVLGEMIAAFSYDVDFQRDLQPGDTFTVLYRRVVDEFGQPTRLGQMVYADMVLSGTPIRLFRFIPKDGEPGYFTEDGASIRKPLLRTPVDGARLSSGFGMRVHPILGYTRMHQGVDFAAPTGTAIYAAGDGVVVRVGRRGGYGNYVEIEHNKEYTTAYAHLSGFARGLREGLRVKQGEVIGLVGMTGTATGPHLHYEVHLKGEQVDPQSIKMPALTRLAGADLKTFEAQRATVENQLIALRQDLMAQVICRGARC